MQQIDPPLPKLVNLKLSTRWFCTFQKVIQNECLLAPGSFFQKNVYLQRSDAAETGPKFVFFKHILGNLSCSVDHGVRPLFTEFRSRADPGGGSAIPKQLLNISTFRRSASWAAKKDYVGIQRAKFSANVKQHIIQGSLRHENDS